MGDDVYESRAWHELRTGDPAQRRAAMRELLAAIRTERPAAPEVLRDVVLIALDDGDPDVRCAAVHALWTLGPIEVLVAPMQAADPRLRRLAFQLVSREHVERSAPLRAAVAAALSDPDPQVAQRALALHQRGALLEDAARSEQVVAMLGHRSQRVRADALHALRGTYLDVAHADVLRAVRRAIAPRATRHLALCVLRFVEPRAVSSGLVRDVLACLASSDRRDHRDVASTLAALGRPARAALPEVVLAHERAEPRDRTSWVYTALRLGCAEPWVIDGLVPQGSPPEYAAYDKLAMLEWLGPIAAAAAPWLAAWVAALDPRHGDELAVRGVAALTAIAPHAPQTAALRERFLARAPESAVPLAERAAAFAPHPERALRVLRWDAIQDYTDLPVDLVLAELEATCDPAALGQIAWPVRLSALPDQLARIAVRRALRR